MVLNLYMYRVKRRLEAASTCRNFDLAGKVLTGDHLEHTFRVLSPVSSDLSQSL